MSNSNEKKLVSVWIYDFEVSEYFELEPEMELLEAVDFLRSWLEDQNRTTAVIWPVGERKLHVHEGS